MSEKILELVMIVKNSGEVLRYVLRAIKPFIDCWTILDTGSTDNTPDIIREELKGVDGTLFFEEFVNFSITRNRSLELSKKNCKYQIILDDSYELRGGDRLLNKLKRSKKDSFSLRIGRFREKIEDDYFSLRIIKSSMEFKYSKKRIHEYIDIQQGTSEFVDTPDIFINDLEDDKHGQRTFKRLKKDIEFLLLDFEDDPTDARILYYLCITYLVLGEHKKSFESFKKISTIKNVDIEYKFSGEYESACIDFVELSKNEKTFISKMLEIQKKYPERLESSFKLATILYEKGNYATLLPIINKLIRIHKPEIYLTIFNTSKIYDYYIPYLYIDLNLKFGNIDKAVPVLNKMIEEYPYNQPLLNIKYSISNIDQLSKPERLEQKVIVIHMGKFYYVWDPLSETNISGSEYMAMNMAKKMKEMGYRVFVFGHFEDKEKGIDYQKTIDGVEYIDNTFFPNFSLKYYIDILIVSRYTENLVYYDNIEKIFLWVHDTIPHMDKTMPLFQTHPKKFKGMIVLSTWQKNNIMEKMGIPENLMILSRNAIDPKRFTKNVEKIPYRFIYMSCPTRGLNNLINIIPEIKIKYPQTTLEIFTEIGRIDDDLMIQIKKLEYVNLNPRIDQTRISIELMKSDVWLYPTEFLETYCISALEAMASRCLVSTVNIGGISTTVSTRGIMTEGPITLEKNKDNLLKKLFMVLDSTEIKNNYLDKAQEWALTQNFDTLAKEWVEMMF